MIGSALLGHEVLVLIYGEDLSPIDDTLPMIAAVAFDYLAGIAAGLVVLVLVSLLVVHTKQHRTTHNHPKVPGPSRSSDL